VAFGARRWMLTLNISLVNELLVGHLTPGSPKGCIIR
jgi:hypothetical protein